MTPEIEALEAELEVRHLEKRLADEKDGDGATRATKEAVRKARQRHRELRESLGVAASDGVDAFVAPATITASAKVK